MKKILSLMLALSMMISMSGCGGSAEKTVSLDVEALYETYSPNMPDMFFPDEDTMLNFLGIDVADCKQYKIAICADGMRTDEVWLIEAKDEAALEVLKELAQVRVEAKLDETVTYAPEEFVHVEKAQILTKGLYLALLISPQVDTLKAEFEAAFQ